MSVGNRSDQTLSPVSTTSKEQQTVSASRSIASSIAFGGLHLASSTASSWMMVSSDNDSYLSTHKHLEPSPSTQPRVEAVRESLRRELEQRLRERNHATGTLCTQQAALCIEKLLFKQYSGDLTRSSDVSTLNDRLAPILQRLMKRKDQPTAFVSPEESRKRFLRRRLGKQRYWKALLLSKEISRIRLQHASLGCAQCNSDGVCQQQPNIKGTLPPSVQKLFFQVSLLKFFEFTSEVDIASLSLDMWDTSIAEAEEVLHQYKHWRSLI